MKIKWFGQSCFLLTSSKGVKIMTDPFDNNIGYELPDESADIVTTSHEHFDHSNVSIVKGAFTHINAPGHWKVRGIDILGVETFHDSTNGSQRGKNTLFRFSIDDLVVCHCGDLGHVLSDEQVSKIGKVDVLIIPIGSVYTIDCHDAVKVIKLLKPKIVIPMHYKTPSLKFNLDGVAHFLELVGASKKLGSQELEVSKSNLDDFAGVIVLDYS